MAGGTALAIGLLGGTVELAMIASRVFWEETRWNTWPALVMLPRSLAYIGWSKVAGMALSIIPALQDKGARVQAFDPEGHEARQMLRDVDFKDDPYAVAEGADVLVIITEWDQFRALDLDRIKLLMNQPVLVDLRNIYKPADMTARGFTYVSVGR